MSLKPIGPVYHGNRKMPWGKGMLAGQFVFLSGCEGRDPDTDKPRNGMREQLFLALDRVKSRLEEGGTSMENIVKLTWYVARREDLKEFRQARQEWLEKNCPSLLDPQYAGTLVVGAGLDLEEMRIEVDVIAYKP